MLVPAMIKLLVTTDAAGACIVDTDEDDPLIMPGGPMIPGGYIYSIQFKLPGTAADLAGAATAYLIGKTTGMSVWGTAAVPVAAVGANATYYPRQLASENGTANTEASEMVLCTGEPLRLVIAAGGAAKTAIVYLRLLAYDKQGYARL